MLFRRNRVCGLVNRALVGVVFCGALLIGGGGAFGQEDQPTVAQGPLSAHVVTLKHINAESVARTLQRVYSNTVNVVPEPSANSLVISAEGERLEGVLELVSLLDVERAQTLRSEVVTKTIQLKNYHAQSMAIFLNTVIEGMNKRGKVALHEQRKLLVIQGENEVVEAVEALAKSLDTTPAVAPKIPPTASGNKYQVRVVWLVSDAADSPLNAVPPDLKNVVAELEKIGVTDLGLGAQMLVAAMPGRRFATRGAAEMDGLYTLEVVGDIVEVDQADVWLELSVEGAGVRVADRQASTLVSVPLDVSTTIAAGAGQSVVLGVTPLGERTSVLVVQVSLVK